MAGTFQFELVTPERLLLAGEAEQVVVPGVEGDFAVLAERQRRLLRVHLGAHVADGLERLYGLIQEALS